RHRARYRLHLGTAEVTATLALLEAGELPPGSAGLAQLFLAEPAVAVHGQPVILREESPPATLGGGRVLQPAAPRTRRRDAALIGRLPRLRSTLPLDRARAALALRGLTPATDADLVREAGLRAADVPDIRGNLVSSGDLVELPVGPRRTITLIAEAV